MSKLHNFGLIRFVKKSGEINITMIGLGKGMIQMWALQNTPKNQACVIVNIDERHVVSEYIGTADGFPKIHKNEDEFEFNLPNELWAIFDEEVAKRDRDIAERSARA